MTRASKIIPLAAVLLLALLALPIPTAHVAEAFVPPSDVWVAPTGDDVNNDGTEAQPFATIQHGIDTVADGGTVHVAAGTYTESIDVNKFITLEGAGAGSTIIDAGGSFNTVVEIGPPISMHITASISGVTIQNGSQDAGGGIFIYSPHTLSLDDCTVRNNTASSGGGILNAGTLAMNRCTVSGNSGSGGGGIRNQGSLYLCNCTISGNSASESGGGIYNWPNATMTSEYTTIANNQATGTSARGGGFSNWGYAKFESTIVANNTAGDAVYNNGFTEPAQGGLTDSNGYNLCGDNSCGFDVRTDLINTDPLLGPLQDNGGPTFTHALLHGSPAIDHGIGEGFPSIDQRGVPRWQGSTCDTGAYELTQDSVTSATGTGTVSFSTLNGYITDLTASAESALACPPREDLDFPHGIFSFKVTDITPGSSATVVIILPSDMPTYTQYWKCINGQWVDCTSLLGSNDGDSVLTLTITDGDLGDRDGVVNGEISDPGGPAVAAPVAGPAGPAGPARPGVSSTPPRPLNPPQMSLQYLSINPQQAGANQPITITTNLVNTGDEAGNYNVTLKINGQVEQSRMVSVGPQGTQPVKFTVTKAQPGTYNIDILGKNGSFTILNAGSSASSSSENSSLIPLLIIGMLLLVTMLVLVLYRRPA